MAKKVKKAKVKKAKGKKAKKYASAAKRAVKKRAARRSAVKKRAVKKSASRKGARAGRSGNDPCQSFREAVDRISQNIEADRDLLSQPGLSAVERVLIEERLKRREVELAAAAQALKDCEISHLKPE